RGRRDRRRRRRADRHRPVRNRHPGRPARHADDPGPARRVRDAGRDSEPDGHPRRVMRAAVAALALALGCAALPAAACSPPAGYRMPSNLELVAEADAILLCKVVAGGLAPDGDTYAITITIRPHAAIKGPLPEGDV